MSANAFLIDLRQNFYSNVKMSSIKLKSLFFWNIVVSFFDYLPSYMIPEFSLDSVLMYSNFKKHLQT